MVFDADAITTYSPKAAAVYLDGRINWWRTWPVSARNHQTFCVSCHTVLPFAMARPTLRKRLVEGSPLAAERKVLDNVIQRVDMWQQVKPFYPDATRGLPKTAESRGTESILNALVLASSDADSGRMSPDTKLAFDNMCAQQLTTGDDKGSWSWL